MPGHPQDAGHFVVSPCDGLWEGAHVTCMSKKKVRRRLRGAGRTKKDLNTQVEMSFPCEPSQGRVDWPLTNSLIRKMACVQFRTSSFTKRFCRCVLTVFTDV